MSVGTDSNLGGTTLAHLIAGRPALAAEFERLGLDFCCHGDRTLAEACEAAGVPLVKALDTAMADGSWQDEASVVNWPQLRLVDLIDHIEDVHHRYLHMELPWLIALSSKVLSVHGERHPELERVDEIVSTLREEIVPHLAKEERVLFPAIRELAAGHTGFAFGSVSAPIAVMMNEHESVGDLLRQVREVTSGYAVPADGCQSYRRLYERLTALESDTHVHVLKEHSFLFPRAVELEAALATR
ncbi:MAG TPA: iron-sulfur cluster repair di-iron protein [Acidimicrobiales bacterium]|nr:iron-sulfur cluster repair di-iron protein [Acidimicrobiales bacterium]